MNPIQLLPQKLLRYDCPIRMYQIDQDWVPWIGLVRLAVVPKVWETLSSVLRGNWVRQAGDARAVPRQRVSGLESRVSDVAQANSIRLQGTQVSR